MRKSQKVPLHYQGPFHMSLLNYYSLLSSNFCFIISLSIPNREVWLQIHRNEVEEGEWKGGGGTNQMGTFSTSAHTEIDLHLQLSPSFPWEEKFSCLLDMSSRASGNLAITLLLLSTGSFSSAFKHNQVTWIVKNSPWQYCLLLTNSP